MGMNGIDSNTQFAALMQQYMGVQMDAVKFGGQMTSKVEGTNVNLTITTGDGRVIQGNMPLPVLEEGSTGTEIDTEGLEKAMAVLENLKNELAEIAAGKGSSPKTAASGAESKTANAGLPSVTTKSALFDIYELMTVILEMQSKMRMASREVRNSAITLEKTQIQARASEQREAAHIGMVMGIVFASVQAGMVVASTGMSLYNMGKQINMQQNSGLRNATADLGMTKNALSLDGAKAQVVKLEGKLDPNTAGNLKNTYFSQANEATQGYAPVSRQNAQGMQELHDVNAGVQPNAEQRAAIRAKFDEGMQRFDNQLANKQGELALKQSQNAPKAEIQKLEAEIKTMQSQRSYVKALQLEGKARFSTESELTADIELAKTNVNTVDAQVTKSAKYMNASWWMRIGDGIGQLSQMMSGLGQGVAQYRASEHTEAATRKEAEEKDTEKKVDEAREQSQSCQDVINAMLKLAAAIVDIENSTNQQIIRG